MITLLLELAGCIVAGYAIAYLLVELADRLGLCYNPKREKVPTVARVSAEAYRRHGSWR